MTSSNSVYTCNVPSVNWRCLIVVDALRNGLTVVYVVAPLLVTVNAFELVSVVKLVLVNVFSNKLVPDTAGSTDCEGVKLAVYSAVPLTKRRLLI